MSEITKEYLEFLMNKWTTGEIEKVADLFLRRIKDSSVTFAADIPPEWKHNLNDLNKLQSEASLEDAKAIFEQVVRLQKFRKTAGEGKDVLDIAANKVGTDNRTLKCIELIESKKTNIVKAAQMLVDMMKDPEFEFTAEKLRENKGDDPKEFKHSLATIIELNPKYLENLSGKSDKDQQEIATEIIQDSLRIQTLRQKKGGCLLKNCSLSGVIPVVECIKLINEETDKDKAAQMLVDMVKDPEFELTQDKLREHKENAALKEGWANLLDPTKAVILPANTDIFAAINKASTEEALELAKTMILKVNLYSEIQYSLDDTFIKSGTSREDDAQDLSDIDAMIFDLERNIEVLDESVGILASINKGGVSEDQEAKKSRLKILSKKMKFLED